MIFKFQPILKSLIWGGDKILPYKGIKSDLTNIGESWEISGVSSDQSIVAGGEYDGLSLSELTNTLKGKLLGENNYKRFGNEFPLLIKFIDAREPLSIQVHPNDELSWQRHQKKGKTEMWYVVDTDPNANLKVGFSQAITPEEYEAKIADNTICDVLRDYTISKGDFFFLPAGRIHSIGAGAFIAEIQQTSDVTYRIYDFGRKDKDGKERELHTELSKDAIDYTLVDDYQTHYQSKKNEKVNLADCQYFTTDLYDLDKGTTTNIDLSSLDSFLVVMCVAGQAVITDKTSSISTTIKQGETILLSADTSAVEIETKLDTKLLLASVSSPA